MPVICFWHVIVLVLHWHFILLFSSDLFSSHYYE